MCGSLWRVDSNCISSHCNIKVLIICSLWLPLDFTWRKWRKRNRLMRNFLRWSSKKLFGHLWTARRRSVVICYRNPNLSEFRQSLLYCSAVSIAVHLAKCLLNCLGSEPNSWVQSHGDFQHRIEFCQRSRICRAHDVSNLSGAEPFVLHFLVPI